MVFQPVPRGIKIELNAVQNTVPIVNVLHVQMATAVTPTMLEDIAAATAVWYDELLREQLHSSYVLENITTTDISVENGQQYILTTIANPAGAVSGAAAAANAAACISWRTAYTGRSFRGRTYIGGLPQVYLSTAQSLSVSAQEAFGVVAAGLIDTLEAIGATLVVVSRIAAGVQRVTALATQIISIIVDQKVDSQRRRTAN